MNTCRTIEEIIATDGVYVSTSAGVSMAPMLRDRKDTIVVRGVNGKLKKYDVILYRRGDEYILHRIIKVLPESYVCRGDNCMLRETGITDADVIARLETFYRGGKEISVDKRTYRLYSVLICAAHPVVYLVLGIKGVFRRVFGKKEG